MILGTAALNDPELVKSACREFPSRVAVGIDARGGMVAVRGWVETSDIDAPSISPLASRMRASRRLFSPTSTATARAGRQHRRARPRWQGEFDSGDRVGRRVVSSSDIRALRTASNRGAIVGRALYERKFTLADALELAKGNYAASVDCSRRAGARRSALGVRKGSGGVGRTIPPILIPSAEPGEARRAVEGRTMKAEHAEDARHSLSPT